MQELQEQVVDRPVAMFVIIDLKLLTPSSPDLLVKVRGLSVFGAMQMAQRKRRNGENNRLGLGLG